MERDFLQNNVKWKYDLRPNGNVYATDVNLKISS